MKTELKKSLISAWDLIKAWDKFSQPGDAGPEQAARMLQPWINTGNLYTLYAYSLLREERPEVALSEYNAMIAYAIEWSKNK